MYKSVYVPVDNSAYSNRAADFAIDIGKTFGAKVTGSHVYAARMHDYRFKQMEYTLPEEYLQEQEIERQRKIHDSLITMGLELISDSYLDQMGEKCAQEKIPFTRKMMDGKHYVEINKDIDESDYDLVVLGAQGIGQSRDSQLGSVCAQVARHLDRDLWVMRRHGKQATETNDVILVAIDGSPHAFGALMTAIELAKAYDKKIEIISVYDPYLHYAVFNGIVDILSERAKKIFRFEEQNQLHEEIIDTGLAQIYQSHLNVAETVARDEGVTVTKTLLDGKAFQKIINHVRKTEPWLLVMGRVGVHSGDEEEGMGNTTENLLRLCPCDLLLSTRVVVPKLDLKAEESIRWTDEAKERMTKVPSLMRGIARTGILRIAMEQGHSVITNHVIDEAMDRFMPKYTANATEKLAEHLAIEHAAQQQQIALCRSCGVTAKEPEPKACAVCGASDFEFISQERVREIAAAEGGLEEETTYDGRKLTWTREARLEMKGITDAYKRRRAKARIEKSARMNQLNTVTLEFARQIILEELGDLMISPVVTEIEEKLPRSEVPVLAHDEKGIEFRSSYAWSPEALDRMLRVPAGFMRDRTQQRVEQIAQEKTLETIQMETVEGGLDMGRSMMNDLLRQAGFMDKTEPEVTATEGVCPFHVKAVNEGKTSNDEAINEVGFMRQMLEYSKQSQPTDS